MSPKHEHVTLALTVEGVEELRSFVWELRQIADRMRVDACPHAEALGHALDRFTDEPEPRNDKP